MKLLALCTWLIIICVALGCDSKLEKPGKSNDRKVDIYETPWEAYMLENLRDRKMENKDWDVLFKILETENLNDKSIEYSVNELLRHSDIDRGDMLLNFLDAQADKQNLVYVKLAASSHYQRAVSLISQSNEPSFSRQDFEAHLSKTIKYSRKGSQMGDVFSMTLFYYSIGLDKKRIPQYRDEAIMWLEKAVQLGDNVAKENLETLKSWPN